MSFATRPLRRGRPWRTALCLLGLATGLRAFAAEPTPEGDAPAPSSSNPATPADAAPAQSTKRAVYIPEHVKAELREQIKQEVLAQAKAENWAAPNAVPEWIKRFKLGGDLRLRYERDMFRMGNENTGYYADFNAINTGAPADLLDKDVTNTRFLNVDQRRVRPRLRARLGLDVDLGQGFTVGVRLASGDGSSPISTNQTLGGSAGNFSKYQFWLDRAFLRWTQSLEVGELALTAGRFENPFFATELVWSDNVNLDGLALQGRGTGEVVRPFFVAGAFPVFTTSFDYPAESSAKFRSLDKWLFAAQVGGEWRPGEGMGLRLGAAFNFFNHVEGKLSSPCDTNLKGFACDTDASRPSFAQKGNTYMPLRTPNDNARVLEVTSNASQYQYFGLASRFRELVGTARFDLALAPGLGLVAEGEVVRNAGFSRKQIAPVALNYCGDDKTSCWYIGGNMGYLARVKLGTPALVKRWDWNVSITYRYIESDAVVDAFNDSDFGLGGTNLKGFATAASVGVADNVVAALRWMSADAVAGPTYGNDLVQIDLAARF